ncbi:DUF58 domain-containing protein [Paracoccus sp. P2]|uniref:DUF58 domain-containing protein n=1 Tax=Paracoccus pantotrophus TaxID=82367 RepID=A0A1I5CR64_PARPN|nr:DUF58 domain-containing protein [Paracoccus pantotrophus]MDF3852880.1 DUF58 domain-containing protein [Paracoccus pantotrophus]QFG35757.1 DUF58 domain-containing protein [Paracoccus pantotrophus]QLH14029.1 DUF58 domain-containing protein [Paracoccus pantotrophus]RDD96850.1 DUF58 domain-containing protein [Paracoccus pantotrophus]RKS43996.1 uncharacterized protein DUF58 [Paracoccus pantotrophus]
MKPQADQLRAGAEAASAALPALMLSAERLAAALVPGAHGQRRAGMGEDFWQYRPATAGDTARSIDWRRSARSDAQFVRDREAQVAQSAAIWVSAAAGMDYAGGADRPGKRDRANLLALALAMALLAGGERVALAGQPPRPGRLQAERLAEALVARPLLDRDEDAPPAEALRPGQRVVLFDDFLGDPQPVLDYLARAAVLGVQGVLMQVLDPDEDGFPWRGAVLFRSASGALRHDTRDAAGLRAAYLARLAERRAQLTGAARMAGWHFGMHDTGAAPSQALLWLWSVLEG